MQILRHGQHGDRRRRLISEEAMSASTPNSDAPAGRASSTRSSAKASARKRAAGAPYGNAWLGAQPRLTDLVPKRYSTLGLLVLAALGMIAGLEMLYVWMPKLAAMTHGHLAALDLAGEGGLAMWFSSALLAASSTVALVVYSVRRHRLDDYHARYRVWLWAAGCWLLMSIDEGGSLHEGFADFMSSVTGHRLIGDGSLYWVGAYVLLLGTVGLRLMLEMRPCLSSRAALCAAAGAYATAVVAQLELVMPHSGVRGVMVEEGCEMLGDLLLLVSMTLHARYVILEAQGLLSSRSRSASSDADESAKRQAKAEAAAAAAKRSDLEPVAQAAASSTSKQQAAAAIEEDYEAEFEGRDTRRNRHQRHRIDDAEDSTGDHKLSKADRKALRREKEKQRRAGLD